MAWKPTTTAGRISLWAATISLTLIGVDVALTVIMLLVTPEDENPPRGLFLSASLALVTAIVAGLVALAAILRAFFHGRDRSIYVKGVLGLSVVLGSLLVVFIVADILSGTHERIAIARVDLPSRQLSVEYQKASTGKMDVVIRVTNSGSKAKRFGAMELKSVDANGHPATPLRANTFPLEEDRVRHYTYPGEGQVVFWTTGEPASFAVATGAQPPPRPPDLSRSIEPGETLRLDLPDTFPPGTRFVVFSDEPGDYAASQWVEAVLQ